MRRMNFEYLKNHILPLSENKSDFNLAKTEWTLDHIYRTTHSGQCPCTKKGIIEHCYIRNTINGNMTFVGNVCVRKFMEIDTGKLFSGLKKLQDNEKAKPNRDLIEYAMQKGYLHGLNEYQFLKNIEMCRNLTEKQQRWLCFINRRIIQATVVRQLPNQSRSNATLFATGASKTTDRNRFSIGSDAQYEQDSEGSEDETSSDAENDSDFEMDDDESESGDDIESDAVSDGDSYIDYYADDANEDLLEDDGDDYNEYNESDEDFIADDDDEREYEGDSDSSDDEDDESIRTKMSDNYDMMIVTIR